MDVVHDQATQSEPDRLIPVGYLRARRQCIRAWKHVGAEVAGLAMLALAARVAGIETLSVVAAVAAAIVAWRGWTAVGLPVARVRRAAHAVADGSTIVPAAVDLQVGPYASLRLGSGRHAVICCAGETLPPAGTTVGLAELPTGPVVVVGNSAWLVTAPVRREWSAAALALLASTPLRPLVQSKAAQIWAR